MVNKKDFAMRKTCLSYFCERNIGREEGKDTMERNAWMSLPSLFDLQANVHCATRSCWYFHVKIRTSRYASRRACPVCAAMLRKPQRDPQHSTPRFSIIIAGCLQNCRKIPNETFSRITLFIYSLAASRAGTKCKSVILHVFPERGRGKI